MNIIGRISDKAAAAALLIAVLGASSAAADSGSWSLVAQLGSPTETAATESPTAEARPEPAPEKRSQVKRTILHRGDVPDSKYEVVLALVEVPAQTSAGMHTHPGTVVGYLIEGEYTMLIEGEPPRALKAGESLAVPSGVAHDEHTGHTPAKLLAVFTVEKGKPLATPVR